MYKHKITMQNRVCSVGRGGVGICRGFARTMRDRTNGRNPRHSAVAVGAEVVRGRTRGGQVRTRTKLEGLRAGAGPAPS